LRQQARKRGLRSTPIAVGVDVSRDDDAATSDEMRREPIDGVASLRWNGEEFGGAQLQAPEFVPAKRTAPGIRAPVQR
jgi:hypothetical protein